MKDKMQMHREIDSLDIVNTVNVDTNLEKERNDASMVVTELLIAGSIVFFCMFLHFFFEKFSLKVKI